MVLTLFLLSILLFAWLRALPGGPVSALLGERGTEQERAALTESLGLNEPIYVQYVRFLQRTLRGEFGTSTGVRPGSDAMDVFLTRLPATIELAMLALLIALIIAIPLGILAAKKRGSIVDNGAILVTIVGIAVPVFFFAFVLKHVFAVQLGWLPPSGRDSIGIDASRVTGFFVLDGVLTGEWDAALDALKHLILPAIALSSIPLAVIFRMSRASVIDVLDEDYVRTARAKGLHPRVIEVRHVLRNALIPVVTTIGIQVGALLTGAVLTERVFNFRGVGHALALGFETRDYAVLQVLIMMAALIYITVNLLVDIAYAVIDPRIRMKVRSGA